MKWREYSADWYTDNFDAIEIWAPLYMEKSTSVKFAKALADPMRQEIMRLCSGQWTSVNDMVAQTGITQPSVSHHLAVLRKAGLVKARGVGRQVFYSLDQNAIADCCGKLIVDFAPETGLARELKKASI